MDKYSKVQLVLIYSGIAIFLTFILLPFFEMFMTSLRPLDHLFRAPYQFWSDDFSFEAYHKMWETVSIAWTIYMEFSLHIIDGYLTNNDFNYSCSLCICAIRFSS